MLMFGICVSVVVGFIFGRYFRIPSRVIDPHPPEGISLQDSSKVTQQVINLRGNISHLDGAIPPEIVVGLLDECLYGKQY